MKYSISRRVFLGSAVAGTAGAAFSALLPMLNSRAEANGGFPRRLVLFHTGNGTIRNEWRPSGTENNLTLGRILQPLAEFKDRLAILDNLNQPVFKHGPGVPHVRAAAQCMTGQPMTGTNDSASGGISIDQLVGRELRSRGLTNAPFTTVELGVYRRHHKFLFSAAGRPVKEEVDPFSAYDRFLRGAGGSSSSPDPAVMQRSSERGRIFNLVRTQLGEAESELSGEDRARLQHHLDSVDEFETELARASSGGALSCSVGSQSDFQAPGGFTGGSAYPIVLPLHCKLARMVLACDQTRVLSIVAGSSGNRYLYPSWLNIPAEHHDMGHKAKRDPAMREYQIQVEEYHATVFRDFLRELDSVDEGGPGHSLLDHSLVVWFNSMANGDHGMNGVPVVLAGGGGGALRTGRFVDCGGASMNDLWTSLCHLMDLNDITGFGDSRFSSGPIATLIG